MNNIDEEGYLNIINDNDNVSKTNDFKEFFVFFGGFVSLLVIIFIALNLFSSIYIQHISATQQVKLEKIITKNITVKYPIISDPKYDSKIIYLNTVKKQIIQNDKNLQNRSSLGLYIIRNKDLNAFVSVDGNLYFTTGLLDKISDKQQLAFVLAHELGHYSHRDNLKAFSRQISFITIASILSVTQNDTVNRTMKGLENLTDIKYSQKQELNADLYASDSIKKIYGDNKAGITFFSVLAKEDKNPDFIYLFANHPKIKDRIKAIQNN